MTKYHSNHLDNLSKMCIFVSSVVMPMIILFEKNYVFIILKINMLVKSLFANQFI